MAKKVYLSPSNQTRNIYAYGNTNEAVQCEKISAACKAALERSGVEVLESTRGMSMAARCDASNKFGADLHVPIHTNAFNGKVTGTRLICYSLTGEGYRASKAIFDELAPLTPGTSENISANKRLYEIRVPRAPTAYVEAEFHDVPETAKWIVENTGEIGEAIAKGICSYLEVPFREADAPGKLYRVQVGAFANRSNAEALKEELEAKGYDALVVEADA